MNLAKLRNLDRLIEDRERELNQLRELRARWTGNPAAGCPRELEGIITDHAPDVVDAPVSSPSPSPSPSPDVPPAPAPHNGDGPARRLPPPTTAGGNLHPPTYTPVRHLVLTMLAGGGTMTTTDMIKRAKCTLSEIRKLAHYGYVDEVNDYWQITPRGRDALVSFTARCGAPPPPFDADDLVPAPRAEQSDELREIRDELSYKNFPRKRLAVLRVLASGRHKTLDQIRTAANVSLPSVYNAISHGFVARADDGEPRLYRMTQEGFKELVRLNTMEKARAKGN
jgi:hypothetical protein